MLIPVLFHLYFSNRMASGETSEWDLIPPLFCDSRKRHLAGRFKSVIDKDDFSYFARVALPARGHRSGCPNLSSPKACAVAINYVTDVMEVSHSSPKRVFSGKRVFFLSRWYGGICISGKLGIFRKLFAAQVPCMAVEEGLYHKKCLEPSWGRGTSANKQQQMWCWVFIG